MSNSGAERALAGPEPIAGILPESIAVHRCAFDPSNSLAHMAHAVVGGEISIAKPPSQDDADAS